MEGRGGEGRGRGGEGRGGEGRGGEGMGGEGRGGEVEWRGGESPSHFGDIFFLTFLLRDIILRHLTIART